MRWKNSPRVFKTIRRGSWGQDAPTKLITVLYKDHYEHYELKTESMYPDGCDMDGDIEMEKGNGGKELHYVTEDEIQARVQFLVSREISDMKKKFLDKLQDTEREASEKIAQAFKDGYEEARRDTQ